MAEYIQPGNMLDYVNAGEAKIKAGDPVVFGSRIVIAATDIAVGATGTVATVGVFRFEKASGEITIGAPVFWDASNKKATTTASSNTAIGYAVKACLSADTEVDVLLSVVDTDTQPSPSV